MEQQRSELQRVEPQLQRTKQSQQQHWVSLGTFSIAYNMDGYPQSSKQTFIALSALGAETNMSSRVLPDKPVLVALPDNIVCSKTPVY